MQRIINKISNRLNKYIYIPIEVLKKSLDYKKDKNYIMNYDVKKCFEDRKLPKSDDTELLKRISISYKKASKDILNHPELFRPSNEWLPIYIHNLKHVIQALEECNIQRLDEIYSNFWRDPCSTGLIGLPIDMEKSFFKKRKISYLDKALYLNDNIHRFNLWHKLLGLKNSTDSLVSPSIGNPYGYFIDNKFIKAGADYQHYYATRINDLISTNPESKVVAEIGGGFGGMAYYLIRDSKNTTYIDFDLPENLALTSYYLLKAFPEKKILLYGEKDFTTVNLANYDIILMPSFELDSLANSSCDLVFNSYSLAEMSAETINHYVTQSANLIKPHGWFFHVNHTRHSLVSARNFPIPKNFKLVKEEFAAWNLGRNTDMDEYEFLYKKD